jgi:hypothetical protein
VVLLSKRSQQRFAICVDAAGDRGCLELHKIYKVLSDADAERGGELRIVDDFGDEHLFAADRFLLAETPVESNADRANRIMADALEAEARLQRRGLSHRIGETYGATLKRIFETAPRWDEPVSFALTFWECWVEAARSDWRVYQTVAETDWPRFARSVARDVRRGIVPCDWDLLDRLHPGVHKTRPRWFRGVFGAKGRIDQPS